MKSPAPLIPILSALLLVSIASAPCFARNAAHWDQKIDAQIAYQEKVSGLLLKEAPELEEIIIINREFQTTLLQMRRAKYRYLAAHHPERINMDSGMLEWTDDDDKTLIKADKNYESLKSKKERYKKANQGHPMWPALRKVFVEVRKTEAYKKIHSELMEKLKTEIK